jgi:hypothetical protein
MPVIIHGWFGFCFDIITCRKQPREDEHRLAVSENFHVACKVEIKENLSIF